MIWGGQKVTRHGKNGQKKLWKKIQISAQKGTRKWVVEVMSSHLVFFLLKMGHSSAQYTMCSLQCSAVQYAVYKYCNHALPQHFILRCKYCYICWVGKMGLCRAGPFLSNKIHICIYNNFVPINIHLNNTEFLTKQNIFTIHS